MPRPSARPPAATLAWAERTVGRGARVVAARRLTGGLTSQVHELTVARNGRREKYVLRRFVLGGAYDEWIRSAIPSETAVLTALEEKHLPVPRLIGSTIDPAIGPALLMTRVPGRVHLMPRDRDDWLRQMARMLVRIHSLDIPGAAFESWLDPSRLAAPPDASRPHIWKEAFAAVARQHAPARSCFIHRDYQHFNLLWTRERLTGVVDWANACIGPPEVDVGHCRLNLTLLFTAEVAERFREMYEAEAGRAIDAWWDVHALLSYGPDWGQFLPIQIDGRAPLDVAGMTRRMEEVLEGALRRL